MKVMDKLVDKRSIADRQPGRDVNEPQIRNPNFKLPRQQPPQQPQIMQRPQRPTNDQIRPPFQQNIVEKEYHLENEEDINSFGDLEERFFLTKQQHDDQINESQLDTEGYHKGYQNAMISFQRQLNLRNRDVVISNPQKKSSR